MISMANVLQDAELGFTSFTVRRLTYRLSGSSSGPSADPTVRTYAAEGCIHPGTPEMLRLLPEEDRAEEFIAVYTGFPLSLGENSGGASYTAPDRIVYQSRTWRVVRVKNWQTFGYTQALAVATEAMPNL